MKVLKLIATWIWCFPQMLVGFILKLITRARKVKNHYRYNISFGSISLGTYVFLCPSHWLDDRALKHEQGHTKQSYILGWLYIPLVLLPSLIWAGCFDKYRQKHGVSYYSIYPENWADRLGGVKR